MRDLSECPWCKAAFTWIDPEGGRSGYADWGCGSHKRGDEPWQSQSCEINVLETEARRLRASAVTVRDLGRCANLADAAAGQVCDQVDRLALCSLARRLRKAVKAVKD